MIDRWNFEIRTLACRRCLFWLHATLAIWSRFLLKWPNFRLLEFWDFDLPCGDLCRQLKGMSSAYLSLVWNLLPLCFLLVNDRIPLLDSVFRFFDPNISYRIYWTYVPLLWCRIVRKTEKDFQLHPTSDCITLNFIAAQLWVTSQCYSFT